MGKNFDKVMLIIVELAANTHPDKMRRLAKRILECPDANSAGQIDNWASSERLRKGLKRLVESWRVTNLSSRELAGIVLGTTNGYQEANASGNYELVWTGPSTAIVPTRKTEQALLEVITAAQKDLFITSFVAYKVEPILKAIRDAIERGVRVSILLESSEEHGGSISIDGVKKMRAEFPTAKILTWQDKSEDFEGGKVHAKVAVADGSRCFLSSANLTGHAMEKNMEAGVLISGGPIPKQLHDHLIALVTIGIVA